MLQSVQMLLLIEQGLHFGPDNKAAKARVLGPKQDVLDDLDQQYAQETDEAKRKEIQKNKSQITKDQFAAETATTPPLGSGAPQQISQVFREAGKVLRKCFGETITNFPKSRTFEDIKERCSVEVEKCLESVDIELEYSEEYEKAYMKRLVGLLEEGVQMTNEEAKLAKTSRL